MGHLKYVGENLKRDQSGIIMDFSPAIFSCLVAGKEMDLTRAYIFSRQSQQSKGKASVLRVHSRE